MGTDDDPRSGRQFAQPVADQVAKAAADPVALDRTTDRGADDETHPHRRPVTGSDVHGQQRRTGTSAAAYRDLEIATPTHPRRGRQHRGQAESRSRPLRRRAARMARPARVRIRSRKPWVLARRRLFGWKVRLLTSKLRLQYDVFYEDNVGGQRPGASGCKTPLYQNAAEQTLDPTQGSDAGQL